MLATRTGTRRRWPAAALSSLVAIGTLAACGADGDGGERATGADAGEPGAPDVVPFVLVEVPPEEIPTEPWVTPEAPASAPVCSADQLEVGGPDGDDRFPPVPGGTARLVTISAAPGEGCVLDSRPEVAIVVDGQSMVLPNDVPMAPHYLEGRAQLVGAAHLGSLCGEEVSLEVLFSDGSSARFVSAPLEPCPERGSADMSFGGWMQWSNEPPDTPTDSLELAVADVPASIVGRRLEFVLVLSNPTNAAIRLTPCPVYRASWGESALVASITTRLNCHQAPSEVPAAGSVRFAVVIDIPDDIPQGLSGSLHVRILDDDRDAPVAGSAPVVLG